MTKHELIEIGFVQSEYNPNELSYRISAVKLACRICDDRCYAEIMHALYIGEIYSIDQLKALIFGLSGNRVAH